MKNRTRIHMKVPPEFTLLTKLPDGGTLHLQITEGVCDMYVDIDDIGKQVLKDCNMPFEEVVPS